MIGKMRSKFEEIHLEAMSGKELRQRLKGLHDSDRVIVCIQKTDKDHSYDENAYGDLVWIRKPKIEPPKT